jgi:hypothetical protein
LKIADQRARAIVQIIKGRLTQCWRGCELITPIDFRP